MGLIARWENGGDDDRWDINININININMNIDMNIDMN